MADNVADNSVGVPVATRKITYSGDANQNAQVVGLVTFSGSDDAKTGTDVTAGQTTMSASLPVAIASDQSTLTTQGAVADNAGFTDGTTKVQPVGFIFDEVAGTALTENDAGAARMDAKRAQVCTIEDATTRGQRASVSAAGALGTAGDVAHGASNSGNPIQNGYEAIAHGTNPTAVTAGQRTKAYANRAGVPFVMGGHPNIKTVRLNFTAAQTNVAIVTVATGLKIVVTRIQVTVDNASTVFPQVIIGFGTATTPTTAGVVASHPGVPAGGGFTAGDGSGIIGIGADDEDLRITTVGAATGNGVDVVVVYYTIES